MMEMSKTIKYTVSFKADTQEADGWLLAAGQDVPDVYKENVEEFYETPFHQWFDEMWSGVSFDVAIRAYEMGWEKGLVLLYIDDEEHYQATTYVEWQEIRQPNFTVVGWVTYKCNKETK